MARLPGDTFMIEAGGEFFPGIECIVIEVSDEDGRVIKAKAAEPDERLGKYGFILEGEDYVIQEWNWCDN